MKNALTMYSGVSEGGGHIQVLWHDQIWVCVKERPWKVQLGLKVRCVGHHHMYKHTLLQKTLQQTAGGDTC